MSVTHAITKGGSASSTQNATVARDSSTLTGDKVSVVLIIKQISTNQASAPDGTWTLTKNQAMGAQGHLEVWEKVATTDGNQSYTFPLAGAGGIHSWFCITSKGQASGADTVLGFNSGTTATSINTAAITATDEDAESIIRVVGGIPAGSGTSFTGSGLVWDAACTKITDIQGAGTSGLVFGSIASETGPTPAGSVAARTITLPNPVSGTASVSLGFKAAPVSLPTLTASPHITDDGTPVTGETVTCSSGTWTGSPTFAYQWKRDGSAISGATAASYILQVADEGHTLTCTVTATNGAGSVAATSDNSTSPTAAPPPAAPANTVAPVISTDGSPAVGETISCNTGTWSPAGDSYARQWKRNGSPIAGATGATYTLVTADGSQSITCTVTATNVTGSTSADTAAIIPDPAPTVPVNTVAPVISTDGTPQVGETVTCSSGTWTGGGSIVYTYQWKRDGTPITGATSSSYQLTGADVAHALTCTVTATNVAGATGATTAAVTPAAAPPVLHAVNRYVQL